MVRLLRPVSLTLAAAVVAGLAPIGVAQAQSGVAISPFVSFLPAGGASPLAGLALAIAGNSPLSIRGSAALSLANSNSAFGPSTIDRPWGADADLVLSLHHGLGTLTPYVFTGIGAQGTSTDEYAQTTHNWSYGAGASIPLGSSVDLFGEARWRMSRYVLPSAYGAPAPTDELRVGVSFRVGGSKDAQSARRDRGRRWR